MNDKPDFGRHTFLHDIYGCDCSAEKIENERKHITDPLSAKEIRDALGVTDEDLEAARRAIGGTMSEVGRLLLISGIVGDYDGAYDWVDAKDYDKPEYSEGYHESGWPGESYTVIEVYDSATIASLQAEVERLRPYSEFVIEKDYGVQFDEWLALLSKDGKP